MLYSTCFTTSTGKRLSIEMIRAAWRRHDDIANHIERATVVWKDLENTQGARASADHFMTRTHEQILDAIVLYSHDLLPVCADAGK